MKKQTEILTRLLEPDEIEWRVQQAKNGKTTVVPYISNRCVMNRFDEAFGIGGWSNTFDRWGSRTVKDPYKDEERVINGVKCGLSVLIEGEWVTKYDGADETHIEATKGGFSDSMKRAAVQWGIGRCLYEYPRVMFKGEFKFLSYEQTAKLHKLTKAFNEGKLDKPMYIF